jgi:endonuclease G, mitochondrial
MIRGLSTAILTAAVLTASSVSASAQWETLEARLALVTQDALNRGGVADQPGFASSDCDIGAGEVAQFDALLSLSAAEETASKQLHGRWGLPVAATPIPDEQLLVNREYVINYNRNLKIPLYATYVLRANDVVQATREKCFREDPRLDPAARSVLADYAEPVFDRGHLVPRADMNRSKGVMINTFVLSNMMPQHDQFNQGIWETLESAVRSWAVDRGTILVFSGPVFDADANGARDPVGNVRRVPPTNQLGLPTHFYKIVLNERPSGFVDAIAILLPHTDNEVPKSLPMDQKLAYLEDHIVSIDTIEARAGYKFFPEMPEVRQRAVKRSVASGLWQ